MVEIGVDKNSMIMFPAPLMSTIGEVGAFLNRETAPASATAPAPVVDEPKQTAVTRPVNGEVVPG